MTLDNKGGLPFNFAANVARHIHVICGQLPQILEESRGYGPNPYLSIRVDLSPDVRIDIVDDYLSFITVNTKSLHMGRKYEMSYVDDSSFDDECRSLAQDACAIYYSDKRPHGRHLFWRKQVTLLANDEKFVFDRW